SVDSFLKPIADKFELNVYGVAEDLKPISVSGGQLYLDEPPRPGGKRSALGSAIQQIIEQAGGRQLAGIVLVTDGQNNGGALLSQGAAAASQAAVPIYAVPVGSGTRLRDVAIADVFAPGLVSVGDTVSVAVSIESQGLDDRVANLELREGDQTLDAKD